MKVTTEELERCEILMTIQADPAQEQDLLKKAARRISRQVQIPGFRPGKAPYHTIVRRFGLETIQQEVLEHSGEKIVTDALDEAGLDPQAPLKFDEITWEPLTIKARVPGPPVVELGDYRAVRLEAKTVEISDEEVAEALQTLQEQNATWTPVERPAQMGDLLTMSVVEKHGDEVLSENDAVEFELTPPDEENEDDDEPDAAQVDFITPLLGLSAGESKTFTINYPADWSAERHAGKEINFTVEVGSVKEKELDPLDDDFAQTVGDVETLDELKTQIRETLARRRQFQYDHELGHEALDEILAGVEKLEWPEALEEHRIDQELERFEERLKQASLTLDGFLNMQHKNKEQLREEIRESVIETLRNSLVLSKVAELEGLEISNMEILERARAIADLSGAGEQFWQRVLSSPAHQASIANDVLTDKIFERLAAIAKGEAPEPGAKAEAEEMAEDDEPPAAVAKGTEAKTAETLPAETTSEETVAETDVEQTV
ncbi:MAG: trigger factor [Anaerolineae bacterium]|nr:trigger factor [Anaerolineae bacterium]